MRSSKESFNNNILLLSWTWSYPTAVLRYEAMTMIVSSIQQKSTARGWRRKACIVAAVLFAVAAMEATITAAFVATPASDLSAIGIGRTRKHTQDSTLSIASPRASRSRGLPNFSRQQSTQLYSFMGSDGGILGIGTPELVRRFGSYSSIISECVSVHSKFLFCLWVWVL